MTRRPTPAELLAGPRGRRLCLEVAGVLSPALASEVTRVVHRGEPVSGVLDRLADVDPTPVGELADPLALVWQVADTVVFARYWQEPDETDLLLAADPALGEALAAVADAVLAAPATSWWSTGVDLDRQCEVRFVDRFDRRFRDLAGTRGRLERWAADAAAEEVRDRRDRPRDPRSPHSGAWWSGPMEAQLPSTSRALGTLGALELDWAEESGGDVPDAEVRPVRAVRAPRVYEVDGPDTWVALVEAYPRDVTASRRHDWWRVTGVDPSWWLPDWAAVAEDHDAVHLTVTGYLTTATRALDVDRLRIGAGTAPAATLLGGWNPDETVWLTDVLRVTGEAEAWVDDDRPDVDALDAPTGWRRV